MALPDLNREYLRRARDPQAYDAAIRAHKVIRVSCYLLRHWARYLGPEGLCLVIAARQMAYEQNRPGTDFRILRECGSLSRSPGDFSAHLGELAGRAGISARTLSRRLEESSGEGPERCEAAALQRFLQAGPERPLKRQPGETWSRAPRRFHVQSCDPLAPHHVAGLRACLQRAYDAAGAPGVRDALSALLRLPPAQARAWIEEFQPEPPQSPAPLVRGESEAAPLVRGESEATPLVRGESEAAPLTRGVGGLSVLDLVQELIHAPSDALSGLCRQLQTLLVEPERVLLVRHYFWETWLPELGPRRVGLLLNLRARCYFDPRTGERRDLCQVGFHQLAEELGCSPRQLSRVLRCAREEEDAARDAGAAALLRFIRVLDGGQGRRAAQLRVLMLDPRIEGAPDEEDRVGLGPSDRRGPEVGLIELDHLPPTLAAWANGLSAGYIGRPCRIEGENDGHPVAIKEEHSQNKHLRGRGEPRSQPENGYEAAAPLPDSAWRAIQQELSWQLAPHVYQTLFAPLLPVRWRAAEGGRELELCARTPQDAEWLAFRYAPLLQETCSRRLGEAVTVRVVG